MENEPSDEAEQTQIDQLLDQWEATYEEGEPVSVETLCEDHPELIPQIRERVAALKSADSKLAKQAQEELGHEPLQIESVISQLKYLNAGGLGEVFVGEDTELHRQVAIKFMHARLSAKEERRNQFALEAEVTGRLEHPGVVPLYGFGRTDDDRLFYAMRYIDGDTLADRVKKYYKQLDRDDSSISEKSSQPHSSRVEFRELLSSFVSVCKTIAYAHNRGIVHRDIKPANVMLGRFGETIVVDWGLAVPVMRDEQFRVSGEETLNLSPGGTGTGSQSGRGSGTPAFMSPEQFAQLPPTPASDIYSLGATLFVILCGKPPVLDKTLSSIRNNTIDGKLPKLDEIRDHIPKSLQAIAYKAMAKEPKDRYSTALDLAHDIERYLADEPVTAHHDSMGLKLARVARRHRSAAQAAMLGLVGCLLIAGVSAFLYRGVAHNAEDLRDKNLANSSRFMARSIGHEIDRIWRVLQFEASAPELRRLVTESNQRIAAGDDVSLASQQELQEWLGERLASHDSIPTVNALFVLGYDGTQVARVPEPEVSQVGVSFWYRDYFTGLGYDLEKESAPPAVGPLTGPKVRAGVHMSGAYKSTLIGEQVLKVTFTVPIWDEAQARSIGIIGTSASIGEIMPADIYGSGAWLADMREDHLEGRGRRGLLLQHPKLSQQDGSSPLPRLNNKTIDLILDAMDNNVVSTSWRVHMIQDPLGERIVHASIEPILIDGRGEQSLDLGWIVITAEEAWAEE